MASRRTRTNKPCDCCAIRRVRCRGGPPCAECEKRSLECTFLRVPRKRGPKGPRAATSDRVLVHQDRILQEACIKDEDAFSLPALSPILQGDETSLLLPLELYVKYLTIFQEQLMSVWPIISIDTLLSRLATNPSHDFEARALAAAVCAATMAQLRLFNEDGSDPSSEETCELFARHSQSSRDQYYYRESSSTDSLLTSFFLHIYFANTNRMRTAVLYLHETIAQLHLLELHHAETLNALPKDERALKLRIFWIVFVTERTFCVQNHLPSSLKPISQWPAPNDDAEGHHGGLDSSIQLLSRLFTLLDNSLIDSKASSGLLPRTGESSDAAHCMACMAQCSVLTVDSGLAETQRVDVGVTRNWIRTLWWEYALRHFQMSSSLEDAALSMSLPASIAHETMCLFASVSQQAIRTHGYGMELKIFSIADALVDLMACYERLPGNLQVTRGGMLVGARDTLQALRNALLLVGGLESNFVKKLQLSMAKAQLPVQNIRLLLTSDEEVDSEGAISI
ncbi:hypothetical protein BGZ63DRAFT_379090 [Mariannaea sp. PMI_226]|nr:hypothetical protein BGZ63DRAFT_379090 [Mariannaea sp. PMI_226]